MKPGQRTTEFWVVVLSALGAACGAALGFFEGKWAALVAGIGAAAYAISRGIAKSGEAAADLVTNPVPPAESTAAPSSERRTPKDMPAQGP